MQINYVRRGQGKPLLLVHGLGSCWRSWQTVLEPLARERSVIAIDLPGFGKSPPLPGEAIGVPALADAVTTFLEEHDLVGVDAVGSSMGAGLVLELARRGSVVGAVVSLDPDGFWSRWQCRAFFLRVWLLVRVARLLQPSMPALMLKPWARALLLRRLSAKPRLLDAAFVTDELTSFASAPALDAVLYQLVHAEPPVAVPRGSIAGPLVIGWGRDDRLCPPLQALRAQELYPDARLYWFEHCGHYPHWDAPEETTRLILEATEG